MPRPTPIEFPISFALLEAAAFDSVRKEAGLSTTDLDAFAKEDAFLGLTHRCPARGLVPRYDVTYAKAVLAAADLPPLPEQRRGKPMKDWYSDAAVVLNAVAEHPASIQRMGQAIQTYYTNIIARATPSEEGLLLPIGRNLAEESPMDFVGLPAKTVWSMAYQRFCAHRGQPTFVPLWRADTDQPGETTTRLGSTVASEIIWHLPGHAPDQLRRAIGSVLAIQATVVEAEVTPAMLFDQAQFNHVLRTSDWTGDAF